MIRVIAPYTLVDYAYLAGRGARWLWKRRLIWLRLLIIVLFLTPLTPTPARLLPYPPQTVDTKHPVVCVHTRLTDEVEDIKIQRTVQLVREMGASTIVDYFPWPYMETGKDQYDWHHPERIISLARHEGLTVIARLGTVLGATPDWMHPDPTHQDRAQSYMSPEHFESYAKFVGAFVAHFKGQVDHIIIWNEPNLSLEWGYHKTSPEEYTQLLKLVYAAAHAANPDVVVMAGALAPTLEPDSGPNGLNDLEFLRRMYEAGAAPYFDALAVHTYGFTDPPGDDPAPDKLNFRRFELQMAIMQQFGNGNKPVYITESGWNDHPRWTKAVRPGQRIEYTLDSFRLVEQKWPTVKNLCIWYFRVPLPLLNYTDYFSFATTEFRVKPIYTAVQAYTQGTEDK